jgi:hypothetical protein
MDWLKRLPSFLGWITFKRAAYLTLAVIVGIVVLTLFEQRKLLLPSGDDDFLPRPAEHIRLKIKDKTGVRMKTYVDTNTLVNLFIVTSASIRLNESDIVYYYSNDPIITYDLTNYFSKNSSVRPLFGIDDNFNASIVRTINGEFDCYQNVSLIKGIDNTRVHSICRMSVPPHYGGFVGYLTVGVSRLPTLEEKSEIRRILADLSSNIFFDNVNR